MTKTTSGSKSPYEIRLELLQLAQSHLQTTFELQMKFASDSLRLASESGLKSIDELQRLMPQPHSIEDILTKAAELYGFVQKRD